MRVERRSVDGLSRSTPFQLLVDVTRQRVFVDGKDLPLEGRDTPLGILAALIRAGGGPMTLEELFPKVWGRPLNPAYDANTVYFHISRLRKFLEQLAPGMPILTTTPEGYMLAPGLRYALIEAEKPRQQVGRDRDRILGLLADRQFVDNRSYCEITGVSRSTALRELAELVAAGVLIREGAGRGVRYRVASTDPARLAAAIARMDAAAPVAATEPAAPAAEAADAAEILPAATEAPV
jgi:DNA-binding winged helix-turn-helix (wHTH) protein